MIKASCIIPTYGRPNSVVLRTLESLLKLKDEFYNNVFEIWLIDQNLKSLDIEENLIKLNIDHKKIIYVSHCIHCNQQVDESIREKAKAHHVVPLFHVKGLHPSVTMAKNYAISRSIGDVLLFFDDDIIAKPNVIMHHMNLQKTVQNIGFLGGREITYPPGRGRSAFKRLLSDCANRFIEETPEERQYKILGRYVGRINEKSFFLCDYSHDYDQLIKVNTVRGCNASLKRKTFDKAGGFDETFKGTALREESDLAMRVQKLGFQNYYFGKAMVIHMRQLGGCNNLAQSYFVVASKMENELRFQRKHFSHVNPFYFFIRLIPLVVETFRTTWGTNVILLIQIVVSFIFKRKAN